MKTPLYETHKKLGARIVDFAGWEMPVQYTSIMEEHRTVRQKVGLFDVSHMGEIEITGPKALDAVDYLTTNAVRSLRDGQAQYTLLLNQEGLIRDDLIVYRRSAQDFLLCVNASNTQKDFEWIQKNSEKFSDVCVEDKSHKFGLLALQGPSALSVMEKLSPIELFSLRPFSFIEISVKGIPILLSRTGYTGEDGFEIFVPWGKTQDLWDILMAAGSAEGILPIGLGARDTLRIEMAYCLYGHEIDEKTGPFEARLGWIVRLDKGDFIGKDEIQAQKGIEKKLICLIMKETGIPRQGYALFKDSHKIGVVMSGTFSPSLEKPIAIGYVFSPYAKTGTEINVEIRGQMKKAEIVPAPFYKKGNSE